MPVSVPRGPARAPCISQTDRSSGWTPLRDSAAKWGFLAAIALLDAIWLRIADFHFVPAGIVPALICAGILTAAGWSLGWARKDLAIFTLFDALAHMIICCAVCVTLSYLVISTDLPLIDRALAASDRALGFDWPRVVAWIQARPAVDHGLAFIYGCSAIEALSLAVFLSFGQPARVRELSGILMIALFATVLLSGLFPATGAYPYFAPQHPEIIRELVLPDFLPLREGTLRTIDLGQPEGLISFPSFHTIMCIIFVYVTRRTPWLFILSTLVNAATLVSTLTAGGHYLTDLLGGGAVALGAILLYGRLANSGSRRTPMPSRRGLLTALQ